MSETMPPIDERDDDAMLAMDFALGALDGPAFRAAELRLRRDPAFAADVKRWQNELGPLSAAIVPVAAPAGAWTRIEGELFRGPIAVVAPSSIATRALSLWRGLALGASAVAALALALLIGRPGTPAATAPPALLAASMATTDAAKTILITATYDAARGTVVLLPAAKDASRGLTPELWIIVGQDKPRSLGLIDLRDPQAHVVPAALRGKLAGGATLAISLEPAGGSPTGTPTGPVVATGTLATI